MQETCETKSEQEKLLPEKSKFEWNISYSDIATKLLTDRLLLTALELHCELTEAGKEIPKLKEFFSNPGNFEQNSRIDSSAVGLTRWSSQATLDSLDMTRYSEDGEKVMDDKVAVLEFELRKAKETISALRTNLTVATEGETIPQNSVTNLKPAICDSIKPHEQRALNFLINEYLLLHGYKLTSITFADENENQDFEVWDDVGLNIPKPPELLHLYRESMKNNHILNKICYSCSTQTNDDLNEVELLISQLDNLKERICQLEQENKDLTVNIDKYKADALETVTTHFAAPTSDSGSIPDHFIMVDSCQVSNSDNTENADENSSSKTSEQVSREKSKSIEIIEDIESDESTSHSNEWLKLSECGSDTKTDNKNDVLSLLSFKCERNLPVAFQKEICTRCYIDPGAMPGSILLEQIESENVFERFVHVVAGSLYKIIPNIPFNSREDAVIFITYTIFHHPLATVREKLIYLLFNLKKKPKEEERKAILSSIVWMASNSAISLIEEEVLPICWEELNHKYVERRLLISELCCSITPYLSTKTRNSIVLPILQQILLEDKEDRVKMSAINSIAFVVTFIDDDNKYMQCEELLFTGLQDSSAGIVELTTLTLLPVLMKWAFDIDKLQSHLFPRLLGFLETQIKSIMSQCKEDTGSPFKQSLIWETRCCWTISAIRCMLPFIVMYVANASVVLQSVHPNLPPALPRSGFADVCRGLCNPAVFYEGKYSLGEIIRAFDVIVSEKTWPQLEWLTTVVICKLLDCVNQIDVSRETLLSSFISLFQSISSGFGAEAINAKIKPIFLVRLKIIESELANVTGEWPNLTILPVYIFSVLVQFQETEEIQNVLRTFLFMLPLSGYPINVLEYLFKELNQINFLIEILLTTLWEGVVHAREVIRLTVVKLFSVIIPNSNDFAIVNRIIPAIVTLSNDQDLNIRIATIQVFAKLITGSSIKEVSDKCCFQLQTILSEENLFDNHTHLIQLISTLGQIASHVDSTFREDVIVPQLAAFAAYAVQVSNVIRRQELSRALLEAYNLVIYCSFSRSTINTNLIPGLRCLETVCADSAAHRETVTSMIKEIESRTQGVESASSSGISSVTTNMSQEVKQRVSKIFQTPMSKQGKFWKK